MKWEFPRLCRGGSQTLRIPGVYLPLLPSFCRSPLPREPRAVAVASAFQRLRSGPFEGPATVKPPALPEDTYYTGDVYNPQWLGKKGRNHSRQVVFHLVEVGHGGENEHYGQRITRGALPSGERGNTQRSNAAED